MLMIQVVSGGPLLGVLPATMQPPAPAATTTGEARRQPQGCDSKISPADKISYLCGVSLAFSVTFIFDGDVIRCLKQDSYH